MEAECNKTTPVIELCRCHTESVNAVHVTLRYFRIAFEQLANVKIESIRGISNMCGVGQMCCVAVFKKQSGKQSSCNKMWNCLDQEMLTPNARKVITPSQSPFFFVPKQLMDAKKL